MSLLLRFRISSVLIFSVALLFAAPAFAQDWRGVGRQSGKVSDEAGKPIEGVVVTAKLTGSNGGPSTKTNAKGEWVLAGINGGNWDIDFTKPGYDTVKKSAQVNEHSTNPPMPVVMKQTDPNVLIRADLEKAAGLVKDQKYAEARGIYENILAQHPQAWQVEPYIARTYYAEHNYDQAAAHLQKALDKDPNDPNVKMLLASVYSQQGKGDQAKQLIESIDPSKIQDPTMLLNVGITLFNEKKNEDAYTWFDKTVTRFPDYAEGYYYRGIAALQLAKNDQAKADLQKFVDMAPNAPEAATAKGILEKIK